MGTEKLNFPGNYIFYREISLFLQDFEPSYTILVYKVQLRPLVNTWLGNVEVTSLENSQETILQPSTLI